MKIIIFIPASLLMCVSAQMKKDRLKKRESLTTNEILVSPNGAYKAWLKPDENFVTMTTATNRKKPIWQTNTANATIRQRNKPDEMSMPPYRVTFQDDNNVPGVLKVSSLVFKLLALCANVI